MNKYIKQYINNLSNPLLYYVYNNQYSVFKNFCLFKNNGNKYDKVIQIKEAGELLEYRINLNKKFRRYTIIYTILLYLIFIHLAYNFGGFLLCETIWIILFFAGRMHCSEKYKVKLIQTFGQYSLTDFNPPVSKEKKQQYKINYVARILFIAILLILFISFSFILRGLIKFNVNKDKPNYDNAEILSEIYSKIYPDIPVIHEIRAQEDYISGDFSGAEKNYIKAMNMYNKKFGEKDYTRFANLLYIIKKSSGTQNAIDIFNEITTKKKLTTAQQSKLLWIKSMFSISSGLADFVRTDYDNLLASLPPDKDEKIKFYILWDKAYMLYLIKDYNEALNIYNNLISYAKENEKILGEEISKLQAERGYTKKRLRDNTGANTDFLDSKINLYEIEKYEPKISEPVFIVQKF